LYSYEKLATISGRNIDAIPRVELIFQRVLEMLIQLANYRFICSYISAVC